MESSQPPGETEFDRLLAAMPAIAEAVNKFNDPETGRAAFDSLMAASGVERKPKPSAPADLRVVLPPIEETGSEDSASVIPETEGKAQSGATRQPRARKAGTKKIWQAAKDINFWPADKQSLPDFAAEKQAVIIHEKNLVVVYYLEEILGVSPIDVSQVLAGYQACGWKAPADPDNSLSVTASKKGWLDTSDRKALRVTHKGRQAVQFALPSKKATTA